MDPNQQSAPGAVSAPTPPSPAKPKKSKLGLVLGLSIGGGLLIIGAVVLVLILVLGGGVSKTDYRDAQEAASDLRTSYSKLLSSYISTYATDAEVKNDLDTIKTNRTKVSDGLKELGEMKAIKNDKEAKELYAKVTDEQTKLNSYLDVVVEYYEVIHPVLKLMNDTNASLSNSENALSALEDYQDKLEGLNLKQKVNKDYIDEINSILPEFISAVKAYANMDYSNYDSTLYQKVSDLSKKLTNADTDWKSNINKTQDEIELSDAFNDLGKYLTDKAYND
jgi:DNA-binding transcriptional regulator GbsR (MarR family)